MNIVVMGGGTGTFTALTGLKCHEHLDLTAIVSCADNGGSSGKLRDEYGVLPLGDIRQCLVALAESGQVMRELFDHRFRAGSFAGHPIGNIILSGLKDMSGDSLKAVQLAQDILKVRGRVIPVSALAADLGIELEGGRRIHGEHEIDSRLSSAEAIQSCYLVKPIEANPEAVEAIESADVVVIGPGDLYTSIIPVLLVTGIREALQRTKAKRFYVLNLATKPGNTQGFTTSRFRSELESYLAPATLDQVIVNSGAPDEELVHKYQEAGEKIVEDDFASDAPKVLRWPLLAGTVNAPKAGDRIKRSLLRHDPDSLALAILAATELG